MFLFFTIVFGLVSFADAFLVLFGLKALGVQGVFALLEGKRTYEKIYLFIMNCLLWCLLFYGFIASLLHVLGAMK